MSPTETLLTDLCSALNEDEGNIARYLRAYADASPASEGYAFGSWEELVLTHGRPFTPAPLPEDIEPMTMKECYRNALTFGFDRRDLTYCEGFALHPKFPMPVPHAWLADGAGVVVDPTWEEGAAYFGIPMRKTSALAIVSGRGVWGVLFGIGTSFLRYGLPPDLILEEYTAPDLLPQHYPENSILRWAVLHDGPFHAKAAAEAVGMEPAGVYKLLWGLVERGLLTVQEDTRPMLWRAT